MMEQQGFMNYNPRDIEILWDRFADVSIDP